MSKSALTKNTKICTQSGCTGYTLNQNRSFRGTNLIFCNLKQASTLKSLFTDRFSIFERLNIWEFNSGANRFGFMLIHKETKKLAKTATYAIIFFFTELEKHDLKKKPWVKYFEILDISTYMCTDFRNAIGLVGTFFLPWIFSTGVCSFTYSMVVDP